MKEAPIDDLAVSLVKANMVKRFDGLVEAGKAPYRHNREAYFDLVIFDEPGEGAKELKKFLATVGRMIDELEAFAADAERLANEADFVVP